MCGFERHDVGRKMSDFLRMNRREWLSRSLRAFASISLFSGCTPRLDFPAEPSGEKKFEDEFSGVLLFGFSSNPNDPQSSVLSCADFRSKKLTQLPLPMRRAHQLVARDCEPGKIWVIGNESDAICRVNVSTMELEEKISLVKDGFVTSGHGAFLVHNGKQFLVTSEYPAGDPAAGGFCLRSVEGLKVEKRVAGGGAYPHVISHHSATNELVVQNLGQQASMGEQYSANAELAIFDWSTFQLKRRVRPGRVGHKVEAGAARAASILENERFRLVAGYQLDAKGVMYPEREVVVVEFPDAPSVSLWSQKRRNLIAEFRLPGAVPLHSFHSVSSKNLLVALKGGGVTVVPKSGAAPYAREWLSGFATDMHFGPLELACRARKPIDTSSIPGGPG